MSLTNFTENVGSITQSLSGLVNTVSEFQLPTVKTQSTFGLDTKSYLGLGALFTLIYFLFKK